MNSGPGSHEGGPTSTRAVAWIRPEVLLETTPDGFLVRSATDLEAFDVRIGDWLDRWATQAPDRAWLVEQTGDGERVMTYGEGYRRVLALAQGLLGRGLDAERPLVLFMSNSIAHATIAMAAHYVGIPVAPVAPAYAGTGHDPAKLAHVLDLLTPGLIIVDDGPLYAAALSEALDPAVPVVAYRNPTPDMIPLEALAGNGLGLASVVAAARAVDGDTIAKFLFTSGSTGHPKAVVNTHRMLCASAQAQRQVSAFLAAEPPVMVDWLPWNHTAGGNSIFTIILCNGGTLYIDPGKPTPERIGRTVDLLKRVSPTLYFNVPLGFEALLPHLEADADLCRTFFGALKFLWYSAAGIRKTTWADLERLAGNSVGEQILIVTGLGMTETSPLALFGNHRATGPGVVGVPVPGLILKLVREDGGLFHALYKGPNVTSGYWRNPAVTDDVFDGDGYFRSGDLLSFVDPADASAGFRFEGRDGEDFKLSSGTRVSASALRLKALEMFGDLAADVVVIGSGHADVRLLLFPAQGVVTDGQLAPDVRSVLQARLRGLFEQGTGSANRVVAALVVDAAPSAASGELTEKGTINGRALLRNRPRLMETAFSDDDHPLMVRI
ncbi:2-succinylbenzoate--CoA ligase [Brevundimonas subvibrioides]|uniref:AMP-binding protein n=1 Tax=Brevundimonas subvibrioides TaxID=74313 RepID=UPI0032D596E1